MKSLLLTILCILLVPLLGFSQEYRISGHVIDAVTKQPLAFVNIVINNGHEGGITDIDGKFTLRSPQRISSLRLSYVGYESRTYDPQGKSKDIIIPLTPKEIELTEVEILPGENPAHRIIRNAIDNRDRNDPEKLSSFSYTSYDKTVFTIETDTTVGNAFTDTLSLDSVMMDSATRLIQKLMQEQYLFLMENVTKRKFLAPDRNYNQVIATKMSGFKDPIFVFLTTQIQSFSFYKPFITIFQSSYVNPIGTGSLSKYFFKIADTAYDHADTVYVISFRPRKGTNFEGLQGVISVTTRGWAIRNVIAEPFIRDEEGGLSIKIQQMYELIDSTHWFPVQLNTDVSFNNLRIGKYKAIGSGRYYIRDIVLNPDLVRREFSNLDVEVVGAATERSEAFWDQYRKDTLTIRDRRTYEVIDSIGEANNFDRMAKTFKTLMTGKIPWGPIEFDINKFLGYNTYEGLILGLGIHTGDRLSKRFKVGGFYQYSFAISTSKYGADARYLILPRHDFSVAGHYSYNLTESGGRSFFDDNTSIINGNYRQLMLRDLDRTQNTGISFTIRTLKYVLLNATLDWFHKRTTTPDLATYVGTAVVLDDDFIFTEAGLGIKWAYGEKFVQTTDSRMSLGTRYPIVWLTYTRGIKGLFNGEFDYNKIDLKVDKTFTLKYLGKLTIQVNGGYVDQPIPACNLYNGNGSYQLISLFTQSSFSTMHLNEFLSNGYASLYLYHDFQNLLIRGKKWFHPEFALSQNIGFGFLEHKERYLYVKDEIREMNLGYYESGLLINNIVNFRLFTLGAGVFYRWGPYSFDKVGDNFAYKISFMIPLTNLDM